ncbi:MAG TPA: AAA family ATPase [Candidatus Scybalomonas excrementigallinarum]|nr:AAA family ATPase [Candidatus Scybalomonas excrementigallinarum]
MPNIDKNTIFYGVPGTGKSYRVKQLIKENNIPDEDVFRATLHPEFSYSNFIGQVLPDVNRKGEPTYKYQKGIFTKALERALKVDDPVLLILEEVSRANIAAVFGDIFQLLDRDQSGKSDYGIDNDLIYNHLDEKARANLDSKKIKIPENLYIVGTVNTSDQNVFPMDNAFKRRFSWQYVSIDKPAKDNDSQLIIRFMSENKQIKEQQVSWLNLFSKLNDFIVSRDKGLGLTEDKQLGPYFIKFSDVNDIKANDELIKNKLLQYLWDDVQNSMAAFGNANITLFDKSIHSFSELYECYDKQQIFSNEFLGKDYLGLLNQEVDNHEE